MEHGIARDALAVIVHGENPVRDLTKAELRRIFTGEATDWEEFGGKGQIQLIVGRSSAGSSRVFRKLALGGLAFGKEGRKVLPSEPKSDLVARDPKTVSYCGLRFLKQKGIRGLKIDGVEPSGSTEYALGRTLFFYTVRGGSQRPPARLVTEFVQ